MNAIDIFVLGMWVGAALSFTCVVIAWGGRYGR